VDIAGPDPAVTEDFYAGLFGWTPRPLDDSYTLFESGGLTVAGVRPPVPGEPAGWLPYVACEDVDFATGEVTEAGGTVVRPPVDIATAARAALVADPAGAVLGLWERWGLAGAQLVNEPGTACWVELSTSDTDRALAFYAKAFGWSDRPGELERGVVYTEFNDNDRVMAGMVVAPGPAHWAVSFLVDDCAAAVERAVDLRGSALVPCGPTPIGRYAGIADPHGARLRLIELKPEILATL
jgi:predicted enzyme related to lactoylglutathione lyase